MTFSRIIEQLKQQNSPVFLAPFNDLTERLSYELALAGVTISGFIDSYKSEDNVVPPNKVSSDVGAIVLVYSPRYEDEIVATLLPLHCVKVSEVNGEYHFQQHGKLVQTATLAFSRWKKHIVNFPVLFSNYLDKRRKIKIGNAKRLNMLKDCNKGKMGFVVCNGPSLKIEELALLRDHASIACNKAYLSFNQTMWRPTYYTVQDKLVFKNVYKNLRELHHTQLVLPFYHLANADRIKNAVYFASREKPEAMKDGQFTCNDAIDVGLSLGNTTLFLMIEFLAFTGCREIGILGADFDYQIEESQKGKKYLTSTSSNNHFDPRYRPKNELWTAPRYTEMFEEAAMVSREYESSGIRVFNLSKSSKLEAFEKKSLSDMLSAGSVSPSESNEPMKKALLASQSPLS